MIKDLFDKLRPNFEEGGKLKALKALCLYLTQLHVMV